MYMSLKKTYVGFSIPSFIEKYTDKIKINVDEIYM